MLCEGQREHQYVYSLLSHSSAVHSRHSISITNHTCFFVLSAAEVFTYLIKEIERDSGLLEVSGDSGCIIL